MAINDRPMIALDHLRKLVLEREPTTIDSTTCGVHVCFWCEHATEWEEGGTVQPHHADCPWLAAKGFVEEQDRCLPEYEMVSISPDGTTIHAATRRCSPLPIGVSPEGITIEEGPEMSETDEPCAVHSWSSRVCEKGTIACVIKHRVKPWYTKHDPRRGFTLIELLVVIGIILLVSVLTIPSISGALSHRQVGEAARTLGAVLAGARDAAIRDNRPSGIRLMPDPLFNGQHGKFLADGVTPDPLAGQMDPTRALAYNRIVPIAPAPSYSEGFAIQVSSSTSMLGPLGPLATIGALPYPVPSPAVPAPLVSGTTVLVLAEAVVTQVIGTNGVPTVILNPPTSWMWNVRLGDKVQINNAGPWYMVVGPMVATPSQGNAEMFVNVGQPGAPLPWSTTQFGQTVTPEFLLLVNGRDDNANGWVDEGWDGVDNDFNGVADDIGEWKEQEEWLGSPPSGTQQIYTISRRPAPLASGRDILLPSDVVIDASSWNATQERTRVPSTAFNKFTGAIDIMMGPDGSVVANTIYSSPSSISMSAPFYQLWLAERADIYPPAFTVTSGVVTPSLVAGFPMMLPMPIDTISQINATAPIDPATSYAVLVGNNPSLPVLKGEMRILTLSTRTTQVTTSDNPKFNVMNPGQPFLQAQQGAQ